MEPFETLKYRGCTIELHSDEDAENPRHEYDNAASVAIWSRDYSLSDKDLEYSTDRYTPDEWIDAMTNPEASGYETAEEVARAWKIFSRDYIWLPLDLRYGAEGISAGEERDVWEMPSQFRYKQDPDGLVFIYKADAIREWGNKNSHGERAPESPRLSQGRNRDLRPISARRSLWLRLQGL